MLNNTIKSKILGLPRFIKSLLVIFIDILLSYLTVWLSLGLRLDSWMLLDGQHLIILISSIIFSLPLFIAFGLYRAIFRFLGFDGFVIMTKAFIPYFFLFFILFSLIGVDNVPRSIGVIQPIFFFLSIGISRYLISAILSSNKTIPQIFYNPAPRVLIYGAGAAGRQLATEISSSREMLLKGFIDDDRELQNKTINGVRVYPSSNIIKLLKHFNISYILISMPSVSSIRKKEIIHSLRVYGVRMRIVPKLIEIASGRINLLGLHDLDMNDLLGRDCVSPDPLLLNKNITNQIVLVTGAGGSIGSELCRQIIKLSPLKLILVDSSEHALYLLHMELEQLSKNNNLSVNFVTLLASVCNKNLMSNIFAIHKPDTVFHAAAYKHVSIVENNPSEGIRNNVMGTMTCALLSLEFNVSNFILISTDKAVRPTNIMGASKRIAELILQALADLVKSNGTLTKFSIVRFGNVLGSSGSVVPLFREQIMSGGPITITHPEATRFFMTIPEAAMLVIQASSMADGGEVFVLDMGQPVRIYDLALNMIYLSGHIVKDAERPDGDIEIQIIGLRTGEKLHEELLIGGNPIQTSHPKIMSALEKFIRWDELLVEINKLDDVLNSNDEHLIFAQLKHLVPEYNADNPNIN